jgi:uncharacterized membrane protein (UPF0136 family)
MVTITYSIIIYALIVLVGGIIGYIKADSTPSLVMGAAFAFMLILSSVMIQKKMIIGFYFSLILTAFLAFFFGYRFFNSFKFMPAGLMVILSLINFAFLLFNRPTK